MSFTLSLCGYEDLLRAISAGSMSEEHLYALTLIIVVMLVFLLVLAFGFRGVVAVLLLLGLLGVGRKLGIKKDKLCALSLAGVITFMIVLSCI